MISEAMCTCAGTLDGGHESYCNIESEKRNDLIARAASVPASTIFCTSHRDALKPDLGDRRYFAYEVDPKVLEAASYSPPAPKPLAIAWIIESAGVPPCIYHYHDVAVEMALRPGHFVTPYYSKVPK